MGDPDNSGTVGALLGVAFTYSDCDYYRTPAAPAVSGWAVVSLIGGVLATLIVVLLVVVSRAVMRTANNARELMVALEEVQSRTIVLADLEEQSAAASRVATEATAVLRQLQEIESEKDGREPNGR